MGKISKIEFTDKDYICMAEILQSVIFRNGIFDNCCRCKYSELCMKELETPGQRMHFDILREKLWNSTGIYLGIVNDIKLLDASRDALPNS